MTCEIISTGATAGNAVLLNGAYLFDCGVSLKALRPYAKGISLVFLTHIHSDHFKPRIIYQLHKQYPLIRFVCCKNLLVPLYSEARIPLCNIIALDETTPVREIRGAGVEWLRVSWFPLVHDVENVGYIVSVDGGPEDGTAMYATDTSSIPVSAPGLDLYMIEANFGEDEIRQRIARKSAEGKFCHEERVMATHLSREAAMAWLNENADPYKSKIVFLHGHIEPPQRGVD